MNDADRQGPREFAAGTAVALVPEPTAARPGWRIAIPGRCGPGRQIPVTENCACTSSLQSSRSPSVMPSAASAISPPLLHSTWRFMPW